MQIETLSFLNCILYKKIFSIYADNDYNDCTFKKTIIQLSINIVYFVSPKIGALTLWQKQNSDIVFMFVDNV